MAGRMDLVVNGYMAGQASVAPGRARRPQAWRPELPDPADDANPPAGAEAGLEKPGVTGGAMMGRESLLWRVFSDLRPQELYALLPIRCAVFIVEQACVFAEIDGKDPLAIHL